jgi:hypothetical protein
MPLDALFPPNHNSTFMHIRSFIRLLVVSLAAGLVSCTNVGTSTTPTTEPKATATAPDETIAATAPADKADYCFECHGIQEGTSERFKNDVHYTHAISCADCHGGDPKINDMDLSKAPNTGFRIRMTRRDIPTFCAGCHSNPKFMAEYNPSLPTNQIALYGRSIHGMELAAGNSDAAECVDCHGVHDTRAVNDSQSPVNQRNNAATCAKCHAEEAALLNQNRQHRNRTTCATCHTGGHSIPKATAALLTGPSQGCGRCHRGNTGPARTASQIAQVLANLENAGPESKEALARARVAVHSFNAGAVQRGGGVPGAPAGPGRGVAPGRGPAGPGMTPGRGPAGPGLTPGRGFAPGRGPAAEGDD